MCLGVFVYVYIMQTGQTGNSIRKLMSDVCVYMFIYVYVTISLYVHVPPHTGQALCRCVLGVPVREGYGMGMGGE